MDDGFSGAFIQEAGYTLEMTAASPSQNIPTSFFFFFEPLYHCATLHLFFSFFPPILI